MDTSGFSTGAQKINQGFGKIGAAAKKLAVAFAGAFAVGKLIQFGKEAIELGSDLSEVQNVVDVTFGNMSEDVNEFARNAITQFGLSETSAKRYSSTMGAMLKSMGFSIGEAKDMSTTLAGLAGDMASFYNLSGEEAFAKIRSGISGETEPLKQLGINLSVANLEQYALTKGIKKSYSAMTQQEQALLRYNYLLSVTSDAQGDFARTSDSWANQTRILSERFNSLKAALGQGLINLLTPALKIINAIISRLQVAAEAFRKFTELLTGNKSQASASGAGTVAETFEDVTDATEEAEKAQKKYLTGLDEINTYAEAEPSAPILSAPDTPSTAAPAVSVDTDNLEETDNIFTRLHEQLKKLEEQLKKTADLIKNGFVFGLGDAGDAFDDIAVKAKSIGDKLKTTFSSPEIGASVSGFAESVAYNLGRVAGSVASIGTTIAQNLVGGIEKYLSENSGRISGFIASMLDFGSQVSNLAGQFSASFADVFSVFGSETVQSVTANIIGIFAEAFMGVVGLAQSCALNVIKRIVTTFDENRERLKESLSGTLEGLDSATAAIKESVDYISSTVLPDLADAFSGVLDMLEPLKDFLVDAFFSAWNDVLNPAIKKVGEAVRQATAVFKNLWENVLVPLGKLIGDILTPVIEGVAFTLRILWENILVPLAQFVIEVFFAAWEALCAFLDNVLLPAISAIIKVLQYLWNKVGKPIVAWIKNNIWPVVERVFGNIKGVIDGLKNTMVNLLKFITSVFKGNWKAAWESVKKVFASVWDTLVNVAEAPINSIIGLINGMIRGIVSGINAIIGAANSLSFTVPDWVPLLGGKHFGFSLRTLTAPQIPYLAKGTVIPPNAPFAAVLGDQKHGTNIEAPIDTIMDAMRRVMSERGNDGGNTYRFTAQLNRRALFDEFITEAKMRKSATGRDPFALA